MKHQPIMPARILLALGIACCTVFVSPSIGGVHAQSHSLTAATLSVSPGSAWPGSRITIDGHGFKSGETVTVSWKSSPFAYALVAANGTFTVESYLFALAAPGATVFTAHGTSGDAASATLTVLGTGQPSATPTKPPATATPSPTHVPATNTPAPPTATPTTSSHGAAALAVTPGSAWPGSPLTLNGHGFHGGETVSIAWNGALSAIVLVSSSGSFSFQTYLSAAATPGIGIFTAHGSSGDGASANVTVLGQAQPSATATNTAVSTQPSATPSATNTPVRPTATNTPAQPSATPTVQTGVASLSATPGSVYPGAPLTLNGSGFRGGESVNLLWNGATLAYILTGSDGTFSYITSLPMSASAGVGTLMARGSSGDSASATITVLAMPTPVPTQPGATPTAPAGIPTSGTTSNGCPITPDQASAEAYVFSLLNQHRATAGNGAQPLALNETLSLASRQHSCDMFQHQNLSHTGSDGSTPWQRITAVGISYSTAGENIGMTGGMPLTTGINAIDSSMMAEQASPGTHHWNIINPAYTQVGIGVIYANGQVWLTEDFVG